jgi:hypothetical protein
VKLEGVEYDVRGAVQLSGAQALLEAYPFPQSVRGIVIGRKCRRLHFLHSAYPDGDEGAPIGAYEICYVDGRREQLPLRYGFQLRDFYKRFPQPLADVNSEVAWSRKPLSDHDNQLVYHTVWSNPRPETEIAAIHFASALAKPAPLLIAVTVEP